MTTPQNNDPNYDPLMSGVKKPAVSFKHSEKGQVKRLQVQSQSRDAQQTNYETGRPDFWPSDVPGVQGNPKMAAVFDVFDESAGELRTLWCPKPSSMLNAVAAAQTKAGKRIGPGGVLEVWIDGYKPSDDKKKEDQKLYAAKYTPPEEPDALTPPAAQPADPPATPQSDPWSTRPASDEAPPF